jgi:hypothetical protein
MSIKVKKILRWFLGLSSIFIISVTIILIFLVFAITDDDVEFAGQKTQESGELFTNELAAAKERAAQLAIERQAKAQNSNDKDLNKVPSEIKNGGFSPEEIKQLSGFSILMFNHVSTYAGYVAGLEGLGAVTFSCGAMEKAYPKLRVISSSSKFHDDLLDRAKDYFYESMRSCEYAFKKNRLDYMGDSAQHAGNAKAFFDRLIRESK